MGKWKEWVASLGDAVVNPGTPLMTSKLLTSDSIQDDKDAGAMKGFAVVEVENMDVAVEIAKSDPFLDNGGTIRISQMMEIS